MPPHALLVLRETAIALGNRLDLDFVHDEDQLGRVWHHVFATTSGTTVELTWHPDGPPAGVGVWMRSPASASSTVHEVVDALRLTEADITWVSPSVLFG